MQHPSDHVSSVEQGTAGETKCEGCWSTYAQQLFWEEESVLVLPAWLPATWKLHTFAVCVIDIASEGDAVIHHGFWKAQGTKTRTMLSNCPASETSRCTGVGGTQLRKTVSCVVLATRAFGCLRKTGPRNPWAD